MSVALAWSLLRAYLDLQPGVVSAGLQGRGEGRLMALVSAASFPAFFYFQREEQPL